ncbi:MAG: methyltransferase domain-containing protein [Zavarzinella sp.]
MSHIERIEREAFLHDQQALNRLKQRSTPSDLVVDADWYLDHAPWIRPAIEQLGPMAGKKLLDFGCGHGITSVIFGQRGATVEGFDLSPQYIEEARLRAEINQVDARFLVANAEDLPYADNSFDLVWGNAILHHLDLNRAAIEIWRVLKSDGVAVFCEPWGGNPVLQFARNYLPYPGKCRTIDERPFDTADITHLKQLFDVQTIGFEFFGMIRRVLFREPGAGGLLSKIDRWVLRRVPYLQQFARYTVVVLRPKR